jgi:hypothetical protein
MWLPPGEEQKLNNHFQNQLNELKIITNETL